MNGVGILTPLRRHRDYRLVAVASLVSLLGDGFFLVAIALQVYAVDPRPLAMSLVGIAWTGSALTFLLVGGWASDRFERRRVMIVADLVRAGAIGSLGLLSVTGNLALWHILVLGAVFGGANAFFNPAATAVVPDLLPPEELPRANAFLGVARPAMVRLAGPAAGGLVVAVAGPGAAFLVDAVTFVVSAALLSAVRADTGGGAGGGGGLAETRRDVAEGFAFVRANRWCWVWLVGATVSLLLYYGPVEVLLPYVLRFDLGLGESEAARRLALIFAAGGLGSILVSVVVGQRGLPRRFLTAMYLAEAAGVAAVAVYGLAGTLLPLLAASFFLNGMFAFSEIGWTTTLQRLVPGRLLGRVSSLDWLTSLGLMPLSFGLAGPVAALAGTRTTLVWAGVAGSAALCLLLVVPGARAPERSVAAPEPDPADALAAEPLPVRTPLDAGPARTLDS